MRSPLAVSASATVLVAIAILSVVVLVLIVVAPWKRVRDEPPLDKDVEARLLLRRANPEEATGEIPTTRVADLSDHADHADQAGGDADFAELRDLDD
ncbi:MAG: hypothetical protein ACHQIG_08060 [Acidimicrobiia bacterium]